MVSDQILTHVCPITFRAGGAARGGGRQQLLEDEGGEEAQAYFKAEVRHRAVALHMAPPSQIFR